MKRFTLALSAAALALTAAAGGAALAQQHDMKHGMRGMMGDPMGDATITRPEAQAKAAAMFDKLDVNHDGKLDQADRAAKIAEHFDRMDTNHDGSLSRDEFVASHQNMGREGMGHEGMEPGKMGGEGHGKMGRPGMGMMGGMMGAMDANHDRTITRAEFTAGALTRFDAADANHDGKLTKEERRAAMRAHMQERRGKMGGMGGMEGPMPMGDAAPPAPGK